MEREKGKLESFSKEIKFLKKIMLDLFLPLTSPKDLEVGLVKYSLSFLMDSELLRDKHGSVLVSPSLLYKWWLNYVISENLLLKDDYVLVDDRISQIDEDFLEAKEVPFSSLMLKIFESYGKINKDEISADYVTMLWSLEKSF